jgi:acyl carrier protein phosphodiesterase
VNYLAHAYLSGDNEELLIGNFIADAVKGKAMDDYAPEIRRGIVLHRAIDAYTDRHPLHKQSRKRLHPKYGHYAGVMIDIYYDHFLARNWSEYSGQSLEEYTRKVYSLLERHRSILPEKINFMLQYMIPQNWLLNYANYEGIKKVFRGMANRTKFDSRMESGVEDLNDHYEAFKDEFVNFFPALENYVLKKLRSI